MNDSSRLIPSKMRAQSEAAISALEAENDSLTTANEALDRGSPQSKSAYLY